jgi:hypothetical protein
MRANQLTKRILKIDDERSKDYAANVIKTLSIDNPIQITIEPFKVKRSLPQNKLMWKSLLGDFSMQVEFDGVKYHPDTWNKQLKKDFLPNDYVEGITMPGYEKWEWMPDGTMELKGSTKQLTKLGFENYLHECYAYGCELGVRFSAR